MKRANPIVAEGLVRRFDEVVAVDGVDLELEPGEVFGFLGPNGAGKSTMVRMLTTLLKPTAGRAFVAGHDVVAEAAEVRRSIGVALQDAAIDPLMTGRELLRLQGTLHGIPRSEAQAKFERLLNTVGLTGAADRRVGHYSGGMRRRLDLALALLHEPEILFLDEPTTGLDPNSRVAIWEEIRKLNRESGTTVFLTTQYMEEADELAGRIAVIDFGKIVAGGTPAALKAKVGDPVLNLKLTQGQDPLAAEQVLLEFGKPAAAEEGHVAAHLPGA
ncbi:MAG: ATP-binding cassette domain-containing protein, partial [Actinomycetota bacterium]